VVDHEFRFLPFILNLKTRTVPRPRMFLLLCHTESYAFIVFRKIEMVLLGTYCVECYCDLVMFS
jgi:hypothetical protein